MNLLITLLALVFIVGLCIGSFLNVVILRSLSEESIVFPSSKCPKCQHKLKWWHNIPVLSYIFLRGKCAFCKEHISIQYPIIELLTGIIFLFIFLKYGFRIDTLFMWVISSMLIVLAGTDIKEKVVFDVHSYILIGTAILYAAFLTFFSLYQIHHLMPEYHLPKISFLINPLTNAILGAIAGAVIMEICARIGYLIAGTRAFGEGDTLIAAGLGAMFGWYQLIFVLVLSVIIQVLIFLPIFVKGLFVNKEWKTLLLFTIFVIYAAIFCGLQAANIIGNDILYIICAIILAAIGIVTCISIFKGLREHPENRTYLPFGPAMVTAAFLMMFLQMILV